MDYYRRDLMKTENYLHIWFAPGKGLPTASTGKPPPDEEVCDTQIAGNRPKPLSDTPTHLFQCSVLPGTGQPSLKGHPQALISYMIRLKDPV